MWKRTQTNTGYIQDPKRLNLNVYVHVCMCVCVRRPVSKAAQNPPQNPQKATKKQALNNTIAFSHNGLESGEL